MTEDRKSLRSQVEGLPTQLLFGREMVKLSDVLALVDALPEPYRAEPCPKCGAIRKVSGIPDAHFCATPQSVPEAGEPDIESARRALGDLSCLCVDPWAWKAWRKVEAYLATPPAAAPGDDDAYLARTASDMNLAHNVAQEVLCRVFDDYDQAREEWLAFDQSQWFWWGRALGGFIAQRLKVKAAAPEPTEAMALANVERIASEWVKANPISLATPDVSPAEYVHRFAAYLESLGPIATAALSAGRGK